MKNCSPVSAGLAATVFSLTVIGTAAGADDNPSSTVTLDVVTVSANKRNQELEKVDGSVMVRSGEDLEAAGVANILDLEKVFPGLVIRSRGSSSYANVSIRGVTSPDFYNPAVQVYVDGVPQDNTYFSQSLMDVERVELLRGPQGTLYGGNAYGGVINIVTRKPTDLQGDVGVGVSTNGETAAASLAAPLVPGVLYGSVAVFSAWRAGSIDDQATLRKNVDGGTDRSVRASLRYAPEGGPFSAGISVQHEVLRSDEEVVVADRKNRVTDSSIWGRPHQDKRVDSYVLEANYDFGTDSVESISSFQDRSLDRLAYNLYQPERQNTASQEIRYAFGKTGPWNGVLGGFFQYTDFERTTGPYYGGYVGASENKITGTSEALFGELTRRLTSEIDLTGGLRYSHDQSDIDYRRSSGLLASYPSLSFERSADFDGVTPKVALGWQATRDHRLYAQISQGYKPGGFNHAVTNAEDSVSYKPETSTNWEIGWHGAALDRRLQANAAAYWIEADDTQIYVNIAPGSTFQTLRNMGQSRSVGLEFDFGAYPVDSLKVTFGGGIGRSTFENAHDPSTGVSYNGKRLPYAPDYTLNAAAQYMLPSFGLPGNVSIRAAGRYYSRTYFDPENRLSQGAYPLFDLSLDMKLDNGIYAGLFADNITDKTYALYSFRSGATDYSRLGDGRIVGARTGIKF